MVEGGVVGDRQPDRHLPGVDDDRHLALGVVRRVDAVAARQHDLRQAACGGAGAAAEHVRPGEAADEGVGRGGDELGRRRELAQPARGDDADPVGERGGILEVVGDEQRGQVEPAEELLELRAHLGLRVRVERRERLVQEEHLRLPRERAREGDALALASREAAGALVGEVGEPEALEQLGGSALAAELDVVPDRQVREERVLLEHEAHAPLLGPAIDSPTAVEPGLPVDCDQPARGACQPGDRTEHRRLARSGRADERDGLAADLER